MIKLGSRVKTVKPAAAHVHWSSSVLVRRRWNVEGVVCVVHDSRHRLICEVKHDDDDSIGYYEDSELVLAMIEIGDRVRTRKSESPAFDWTPEALASQRWGEEGRVIESHDSHGETFTVQHDVDGSTGFYEACELVKVQSGPELDLKGYREQCVKELLVDWNEGEMDADILLQKAFDFAVDRVKQQYINQYEKLIVELRKTFLVYRLTNTAAGMDLLGNLLRDFELKWETGFDGWQDGAEIEYRCAVLEGPHDLRAAGWAVAVHNDYTLAGKRMTFWLLTKTVGHQLVALKGEGTSDRDALDQIRQHAFSKEEVADGSAKQVSKKNSGDQF